MLQGWVGVCLQREEPLVTAGVRSLGEALY